MMTIEIEQLVRVRGGMNTDGFRRSDNIEDRRTPFEIQEDDQWMSSLKEEQAGIDAAKRLRDAQVLDQWRQRADALQRGMR